MNLVMHLGITVITLTPLMLMVFYYYDTNPFKHIWTYANSISSDNTKLIFCPCKTGNTATVIPSFTEMLVTHVNQE